MFQWTTRKGYQAIAGERLWGYDLPAQLIYNLHLLQQVEGAHKKPGASRGHQMQGHWIKKWMTWKTTPGACTGSRNHYNWGWTQGCTLRADKESISCFLLSCQTVDFWWIYMKSKMKRSHSPKWRLRPPRGPKTWPTAPPPLREPFKWTQDVTDGHTYRTWFRYETY